VRVDDVDLSLWSAELAAKQILVEPAVESSSSISVRELRARWGWGGLLRGSPAVDVVLSDVAVTLDLRAPWLTTRGSGGPRAGLGPLQTLVLDGGRIALIMASDEPPLLVLDDVAGELVDESAAARDGSMTTRFTARARTDGGRQSDAERFVLAPRSA
jgi:hypothetical protein